jgi:hypothetical protein
MEKTIADGDLPVRNPFFIGQEPVDVPAMRLDQVIAISDSNVHGVEFIRLNPTKEPGSASELEHQLPILAQG